MRYNGLRVAVLYNDDTTLVHGGEADGVAVAAVGAAARAVVGALEARGHRTTLLGVGSRLATLADALGTLDVDLVFNLVEGLNGDSRLEAAMAWLYELAGLPYTGSPPETLTVALDKARCKALLHDQGVPVARGVLLHHGDEPLADVSFPAIVKPAREDASHGIAADSVVATEAAARIRARQVIERYRQPALVETFLSGREFNVSVLGTGQDARCLELAEIDFDAMPSSHPPLVTYEAKWDESSEAYRTTPSVAARAMTPSLTRAIETLALDAYLTIGLRDYGRVDIRLDPDGDPRVLEVNPNPDISPDAGVARAAERSGISYVELIEHIVHEAARRG